MGKELESFVLLQFLSDALLIGYVQLSVATGEALCFADRVAFLEEQGYTIGPSFSRYKLSGSHKCLHLALPPSR